MEQESKRVVAKEPLNASELRIGNHVSIVADFEKYGSVVYTVTKLTESLIVCRTVSGNFHGILLTPEWLDKAGFKKSKEGWRVINKYLEYEFRLSENLGHDVPMCGCMCIKDFSQTFAIAYHIKYLHQLQNLYYSLTGAELTFKP